MGAAWPTELAAGGHARLERVLRSGLTWDPLGRPWSASEFAMRLREAGEMDVPTGTITLALVAVGQPGPGAATAAVARMEAAGGRVMTTASVPAGTALVAFTRAADAAGERLTSKKVAIVVSITAGTAATKK